MIMTERKDMEETKGGRGMSLVHEEPVRDAVRFLLRAFGDDDGAFAAVINAQADGDLATLACLLGQVESFAREMRGELGRLSEERGKRPSCTGIQRKRNT